MKQLIPKEIIKDRRGQSAIYITINKKLMADTANQTKLLYAIISANTLNYFDRVAHPFASLTYLHFGLSPNYVKTFFQIIEEIKMYLMTLYGVLKLYYTDSTLSPF